MSNSFWQQVGLAVVGAGLFVGSAFAAKECEDYESFDFPGVDADGMLSENPELAATFQCHQCENTKNGKYRIKCEGTVGNESGENQKYKNEEFFALDGIVKSLYKVKASGAGKLISKGQFTPE